MQNLPQKEIFSTPLSFEGKNNISNFIEETKNNPARLQQLAIDASYLLSNSEERLISQQKTGFFKRFVGAFTGKADEITRQNQANVIEMQKYAWYFLQELQKQNLITGKSIAVIRNNLVTINDAIIETRDFLEKAIEKIDSRLNKVEGVANLNRWKTSREVKNKEIASIQNFTKTLIITYDFIKQNYEYINDYGDMDYIFSCLYNADIDIKQKVSLNHFILALFEEFDSCDKSNLFSDYHQIIRLDFDKFNVDNDYILKNISGVGIKALYFLSEHYSRINDFLVKSEDKEETISKFFGKEFGHLSEVYSIKELVFEIIGGCLTAIDLYKEENNLLEDYSPTLNISDKSDELISIDIDAMLSIPEIQNHTWLKNQDSEKVLRYLEILSLCCDTSNSYAVAFFKNLTDFAGLEGRYIDILRNKDKNKSLIYDKNLLNWLLKSDEDKYTLISDMLFLNNLSELENKFIDTILLNTKPQNFREVYPELLKLVTENDHGSIIQSISKIIRYSKSWKNIISYREIDFSNEFECLKDKLSDCWISFSKIS